MKFLTTVIAVVSITGCTAAYVGVGTFEEAPDPVELTNEAVAAWERTGRGLHASWADDDLRYARSEVPVPDAGPVRRLVAWRGERVSAQFLLWSAEAVDGVRCEVADLRSGEAVMPSGAVSTRFVRYTLADENIYMPFSRNLGTVLSPDMLDSLDRFDMAARETRPVWLTLDVPRDAEPGVYRTSVTVRHNRRGKISLPLEVEVQDRTLAPASEWDYHLDLWQHPASVARIQGLEVWSDAHFEALEPLMQRLADAGQKVVTATLNKDPWNHQCYDAYAPMILWTKHRDGSWSYDYKVFDRWVEMMLGLGIDKAINCYSMVPWNCELEYFDETEDSMVTVKAEPGTKVFAEIWTPFLLDFKQHLETKGWLSITNIAMDERSPEAMTAAADVLASCAPEMGFALADNHKSYKKFTMMRDVCVAIHHSVVDPEDIRTRRERGQSTTFYICCDPVHPNTFATSNPYEAEILGWYNVAHDYDGMLRWAYNSWAEDPQYDSRYGRWMGGDTYLVYPCNRSSIRFEKLRDGIEAAEKVRQLRREGADVSDIDAVLEKIRMKDVVDHNEPWKQLVQEARAALDEVSRK